MKHSIWHIPATSANLGPGFDALGLGLDLYNTTRITLREKPGVEIVIRGEGEAFIPRNKRNLTWRAFQLAYQRAAAPLPTGVHIEEENRIPASSGLGSSAAAVLAGLLTANDLLGQPFAPSDVLALATEIEGHPDNVSAALYGGLTVNATGGLMKRFPLPAWTAVVVTPQVHWPTHKARAVLPRRINRRAAVRNIGRALLTLEAFRSGDFALLRAAMHDELHQPYRLLHIPGAQAAMQVAQHHGAAVALSGAGPSLIAFVAETQATAIGQAMLAAFTQAQVNATMRIVHSNNRGAYRG